jgi:mRNA-degrading endonuclease RelE of RelBE toxin-antitoxin system
VNWTVRIAQRAARSVARAPTADRLRLLTALHEMRSNPFRGDVLRLQGPPGRWRRRVGNWRIFFAVSAVERTVEVSAVVRRTSTTY